MSEYTDGELRRLAAQATPGPWYWASHETVDGDAWVVDAAHGIVASNHDGWSGDAPFIAAARSAVPDLLDRVADLEATLQRVRDVLTEWEGIQAANREQWSRGAIVHLQSIDCVRDLQAALDGGETHE